jgi:HrpA-like RNA helicase
MVMLRLSSTACASSLFANMISIGHYLSILSLEPALGKLVLVGLAMRCLDPVLTIACVAGNRDPFIMPMRPDLQVCA